LERIGLREIKEKLSSFKKRRTWKEFKAVKKSLKGTTVEITMDGNRRAEKEFGWAEGIGTRTSNRECFKTN